MNAILKALRSVGSAFVGFFRSGKAQAAFEQAAALVPKALPIVTLVASLTPTLADDELVALFRRFALPYVEQYLALPKEQRGVALLKVASTQLASIAPGTPTRILDTAVQLAYVGFRAGNQ
jgi:hypothetical protein